MRTRSAMRFTFLGLALAAGSSLSAQATTGALVGKVVDANGKPMAGAKVILSSPASQAPRVVSTDANGEWHAPLLPVGAYRLQVIKDGFFSAEVRNLRVGIGTAIRQDLALKPIQVGSAVVEVVGGSAEVDKADTKSSANFSAETLDTLAALDRSFTGAADLAPGVAQAPNGGFSIRGGATNTTLYRLNGTDIKDDLQGAQVGTWVIEDNIADVQVVLSPLNARNGRSLGGQLNVVTKTGSNDFAGSFRAHLSRPDWSAKNPYTKDLPGATSDNLSRTYDLAISGPIMKDRLWFSVGTILSPSGSASLQIGPGNPMAQGPQRTGDPIIDNQLGAVPSGYVFASSLTSIQPYTQTFDSSYIEAKLTGSINPNHTVEVSYVGSGTTIHSLDPGVGLVRLQALGTQTEKRSAYGINWRAILGDSTFLETRLNRFKSQAVHPTGDPNFSSDAVDVWYDSLAPNPHYYYQVGFPFGAGVTPSPDKRNNTSANVNLNLFRDGWGGHHEIDLGLEYYAFDWTLQSQMGADNRYFRVGGAYVDPGTGGWLFPAIPWTGPYSLGQSGTGNTGLAPVMWQYYGKDGVSKNVTVSGYANDNLTVNNHVGVMIGLRWDTVWVDDTTGSTLAKANDWSPRFQLRYDLKGDSHHVFTLTAARFQSDFSAGFTSTFITGAGSKEVSYGFSGIPGQSSPLVDDGNALRWLTYAQLTNPAYYTKAYSFSDNSRQWLLDPNLRAPYMDEETLTYRRSSANGNFVRITVVNRDWRKDWAFATDYDASQMATITDPSGSGLPSRLAPTVRVFNSDALRRNYKGLELEFQRRLSPWFTFGGNYTYGRLTGNNNGGDSSSSTFRDNSIPGYYGNRAFLTGPMGLTDKDIAPTGPLIAGQSHRARLTFTVERPLDKGRISYSALVRYDSGNNWSATYPAPLSADAGGPLKDIPNAPPAPATYNQYYGGRGQYTFNDIYQVDLKVSYHLPLGYKNLELMGDIQVSNLFNQMEQATYTNAALPLQYGASHLYLNTTPFGTFGKADPNVGNFWISGRSFATSIGLRF